MGRAIKVLVITAIVATTSGVETGSRDKLRENLNHLDVKIMKKQEALGLAKRDGELEVIGRYEDELKILVQKRKREETGKKF